MANTEKVTEIRRDERGDTTAIFTSTANDQTFWDAEFRSETERLRLKEIPAATALEGAKEWADGAVNARNGNAVVLREELVVLSAELNLLRGNTERLRKEVQTAGRQSREQRTRADSMEDELKSLRWQHEVDQARIKTFGLPKPEASPEPAPLKFKKPPTLQQLLGIVKLDAPVWKSIIDVLSFMGVKTRHITESEFWNEHYGVCQVEKVDPMDSDKRRRLRSFLKSHMTTR